MRSNEIEQMKKKLKLGKIQREVLVGILLGDATLESQNQGRTFRLKVEHSIKQAEYVDHLYQLFMDWVLTQPRKKRVHLQASESINMAFSTVSHGALRFFARQFYDGSKKKVPKLIHRWLSPRAFAYWYMDDGSIKSKESKGVILNTQGFERMDIKRLVDALKRNFALEAWERRQKEGFQIYISGYSFERFVEIVQPYILPSMRYKIPKPRRT